MRPGSSLQQNSSALLLTPSKSFTVSVVSHGHGAQVEKLLHDISKWSDASLQKVIVTLNVPDLDAGLLQAPQTDFPFVLQVIKNTEPKGFGANHNRAFRDCSSDYFFVLNPDLELPENPFPGLLNALASSGTGCAYPAQISPGGTPQDFERTLPTPAAVFGRRFGTGFKAKTASKPDWISGAFMAFNASVFRDLGGFDEQYFMYCEDVDICLRLQLAGFELTRANATVVHHAHRQTTKSLQHLAWHVRSLLRLWNSAACKAYKQSNPP